jgi:hypothetical protein
MENIQYLDLAGNQIIDLTPLVENPFIGQGCRIVLFDNPLSEEAKNIQIPALEKRGVEIIL